MCSLSFLQKPLREHSGACLPFIKNKQKKSERGEINRLRFRRLSDHAAAAEEPRATAVTCLTCPSFFPPVALSVSRSPLLPSFLSPPALSLSRWLYLSLSSPRARRRRERRLSVAALVLIWRVRMCRVMYRYLHNPSADVCEDSRKKRKERKKNTRQCFSLEPEPFLLYKRYDLFWFSLFLSYLLLPFSFDFSVLIRAEIPGNTPQIRAHTDTAACSGNQFVARPHDGHDCSGGRFSSGFFFFFF